MKNKKLYILIGIMLLVCVGCSLVEPKTDSSGKTYTDMETYLKTAGGFLQQFGVFVPGWGTLVSGFGGLLAIIGGSITSISMTRRRGKTLDTVIMGVNEASKVYDETKAVTLSELKTKLQPIEYAKVEVFFEKATSIKEIIKVIADYMGTESFLHSRVKRIG